MWQPQPLHYYIYIFICMKTLKSKWGLDCDSLAVVFHLLFSINEKVVIFSGQKSHVIISHGLEDIPTSVDILFNRKSMRQIVPSLCLNYRSSSWSGPYDSLPWLYIILLKINWPVIMLRLQNDFIKLIDHAFYSTDNRWIICTVLLLALLNQSSIYWSPGLLFLCYTRSEALRSSRITFCFVKLVLLKRVIVLFMYDCYLFVII